MKDILRLLRDNVHPHWKRMLAAILLTSMVAVSPFVYGYIGKVMVDDVLQVGGLSHSATVTETYHKRLQMLIVLFAVYVVFRFIFIGANYFYAYLVTQIGQRIVLDLRHQLHDKLQRLQMTYFDQQLTGKLMSRILDDVSTIQSSITGTFVEFIRNSFTLVVGVVVLLGIDKRLAIIALATLPFYGISYRVLKKRLRQLSEQLRRKNAEMYGLLEEKIAGVRVVKSFAQERHEIRSLFHKGAELFRLRVKRARLNTWLGAVASLISAIGTALILYYGAYQVRDGALTLGELLFFYGSVGYLFTPIVEITNMTVTLQWIMVVIARIFDILDEEITIHDRPGALPLKGIRKEIEFCGVSMRYPGTSQDALHNATFFVPAGSVVSLVGPSGAGKSTLVHLLLRLYDPTEGAILIDGKDIRDYTLISLRSHIRIVPQEPILFSGTIAENIRYGRFEATPEEVVAAAKAAELHDFIYTLPEKYETEIGERGVSLSGGQKQRLAFAMAILTNPSILILDDSTSALDAETEERIRRTLERIMAGRTAFIITHRVATAMKADMIVVLDKGQVVEIGQHEELVGSGGFYTRMYERQRAHVQDNGRSVFDKVVRRVR